MDSFKAINNAVPFRAVVEKYIGEIKNGFVKCPAHAEKTASCKAYKNRVHCFGCGYSADAIQVVADALSVRPLEAAKTLNEEYGLGLNLDNPDKKKVAAALREKEKKHRIRKKKLDVLNREYQAICEKLRACRARELKTVWDKAEQAADLTAWEHEADAIGREIESYERDYRSG